MRDLNALSLRDLFAALSADGSVSRVIEAARLEDLAEAGDVTSKVMIPTDARANAELVARGDGVVAGVPLAKYIIRDWALDIEAIEVSTDGRSCEAGETLLRLSGNHRDVLALERTLLNFIGRLSGIATLTSRYVRAIRGSGAVVCDTRKTTPGLRSLEKYAVRCGGGTLHRLGLHDAVLIKDNHLAHIDIDQLTSHLNDALREARSAYTLRFAEVEVDSIEQLERVLACEEGLVDLVLLDNMSSEQLQQAVRMRDERGSRVQLEASGGITLETIARIAETGVERLSIGALTHSAISLDVSLDIV